jgi:cyclopropane fatty-acyl-phospholipid synthase-like methyltransferase
LSTATGRVRDLYDEWFTDLMAHTHGGHLHGGYWAGPDRPATMAAAGDRLTDVVVDRCRLTPGMNVLDIGSGHGKATVRVATRHRVRVSGVTISERQVQQAGALAAEEGLTGTVDFTVADMREMPFPDSTFDAAYAIESVSHIPDRTIAFAETARVLRPGGRIAVTDFLLRRPIADRATARRLAANSANFENGPILTRDEYEAAVRAAGLEVVGLTDVGEAVRPTFSMAAKNMRAARNVVGDRMTDKEFGDLVDTLEQFGAIAELGYAIMVARKAE